MRVNKNKSTVKKFIPKQKDDFESIEILKATEWAEIYPFVDKLLVWVQDMNWPIAADVADILSCHTNSIQKEIIEILRTNDGLWKYWCIRSVIYYTKDDYIGEELTKELKRLSENPSEMDKEDDVDIAAKKVLDKFKR